jgi:hypothetical protein
VSERDYCEWSAYYTSLNYNLGAEKVHKVWILWGCDQMVGTDKVFAGSIPEIYDRYLVALIFDPYAIDLAGRLR